jgi:peptidoglycan hydrolase CwlO-like protein
MDEWIYIVIFLALVIAIVVIASILGWKLFSNLRVRTEIQAELKVTKNACDELVKKYKNIIDIDTEIEKRKEQIEQIQSETGFLKKDHNDTMASLNERYTKAKGVFDELQRELALTEETLEIQSYGLYKPHYDFATSDQYKFRLEECYEKQKYLIKQSLAIISRKQWTVDGSKREGEKMIKQHSKLMLRAFNGECDSAIAKVRWNNITAMEERIMSTYDAINKLGAVNLIEITPEYRASKLEELRLLYEYEWKLHNDKEKQREEQERIRDEERAQREFEKQQREAEDEEKRYQKALDQVKIELESAKGKEVEELNAKIQTLEQQLKTAQETKERAISRAQLTRSGYVYVISNIGSFGEDIYKIGMTRRLEPMDRVRELGDASVPFQFDVHAMVYSEDAPELERKLHEYFDMRQINLVNDRKEFFKISIDEVEAFARTNKLDITVIKLPEAREYRQSLALREQMKKQQVLEQTEPKFPTQLV